MHLDETISRLETSKFKLLRIRGMCERLMISCVAVACICTLATVMPWLQSQQALIYSHGLECWAGVHVALLRSEKVFYKQIQMQRWLALRVRGTRLCVLQSQDASAMNSKGRLTYSELCQRRKACSNGDQDRRNLHKL